MDTPTPNEARAQESGYRAGYRHGYAEAVDNLRAALAAGLDAGSAMEALVQFHDARLLPWNRNEARDFASPPRFRVPA